MVALTHIIMRTFIFTVLLTILSDGLYGQSSLDDSIIKFEADCSEAVSPEDDLTEFTLLKFRTNNESTTLSFEIIVNCAQQNKGILSVSGDTLMIEQTDVTITTTKQYEEVDSITGHTLIITEETHSADVLFCDCLVNFYYELSTSLTKVRFLKFHGRIFELNRTG